jgi:hypothetical protein
MSSRPCRIQPTLLRIDPHLHDHPRDLRRVSVRTIAGEPPDTAEAVDANFTWLQQSNLPKILFHATPGAIMPPTAVERCKSVLSNLTSVWTWGMESIICRRTILMKSARESRSGTVNSTADRDA